jgi:hypothetical protein
MISLRNPDTLGKSSYFGITRDTLVYPRMSFLEKLGYPRITHVYLFSGLDFFLYEMGK